MHTTQKSTNAYRKYIGVYNMSLAFEVGEEVKISSQNRTLLSVQSIHAKHNNEVNNHDSNHTNKIRKHTKPQSQQKGFKLVTKIQLVKRLSEKGHRVSY